MLVLLCVAIFIGTPLLAAGKISGFLFDIVFSLLIISGVVTIARKPVLTAIVLILALATIALRWATYRSPESEARTWAIGLSILLLSILAALVLMQVLRQGPITAQRIQGAIVVYLLAGLAFSAAYELVYRVDGEAFQVSAAGGLQRPAQELLYFSFITLTTVGYGDITPRNGAARSLVVAEALTGQLYLAILIARLVSMQISARSKTPD
jgi:hypothetical protein